MMALLVYIKQYESFHESMDPTDPRRIRFENLKNYEVKGKELLKNK
jgi:hypothetical protein